MKKLIIALLCVALSAGLAGCNKKEEVPDLKEPSVKVIEESAEEKGVDVEKDAEAEKAEKTETKTEEDVSADRTEESDRTEIANNIRDAKELIAEELYDDAEMILKALESRELTDEEQKEIEELKKILAEANI